MPVKDYYQVLELPYNARDEDIKKAYRKLAMRYHPDRNTGNPFAVQHFQEVQEAYDVLSNPVKRSEYHQLRWQQMEISNPFDVPLPPTAEMIYQEAVKVKDYVRQLDVFRMNQEALCARLSQLVNQRHLRIFKETGDRQLNVQFTRTILQSMNTLSYPYWKQLLPRLIQLAETDNQLLSELRGIEKAKQFHHKWNRLKPLVILVIVVLICVLIYIIA